MVKGRLVWPIQKTVQSGIFATVVVLTKQSRFGSPVSVRCSYNALAQTKEKIGISIS